MKVFKWVISSDSIAKKCANNVEGTCKKHSIQKGPTQYTVVIRQLRSEFKFPVNIAMAFSQISVIR